MRILFTILTVLFSTLCINAQWHDAVWMYGAKTVSGNPNWGNFKIDFNGNEPLREVIQTAMNIDSAVESFCDSTGNLLYYSNGFKLFNHLHELIEGGDSLNPGEFSWYLMDNNEGQRSFQSMVSLQQTWQENRYMLIHQNLELHDDFVVHLNPLYYSVIDMGMNGGSGQVLEKNVLLLDMNDVRVDYVSAIKHANGRDWWVILTETGRHMFHKFYISPNGVESMPIQELIPNDFYTNVHSLNVFSQDGSKYARYIVGRGLYVYDFDRCTGTMGEEPAFYPQPNPEPGGGVAFSPNGRFVYLASLNHITQVDLMEPDSESAQVIVASNHLFLTMQLGPDGVIYINLPSGVKYLHRIRKPNLKGEECSVSLAGFSLPFYNIITSPHYPNYRLGPIDGSPCDTLGFDNHPLADFRHQHRNRVQYPLQVEFYDNSFYEPTDWYWDFGDGASSTELEPVHTFPAAGFYNVCLTVSNQNSSNTVCKEVEAINSPYATSTSEVVESKALHIFPNPTSTSFTLSLPAAAQEGMQVRITDMYGRELSLPGQSKIRAGTWQHTLDASHLPAGVYWVSVHRDGGEVYGGKLVVQ
jgi:hypothetical protein